MSLTQNVDGLEEVKYWSTVRGPHLAASVKNASGILTLDICCNVDTYMYNFSRELMYTSTKSTDPVTIITVHNMCADHVGCTTPTTQF